MHIVLRVEDAAEKQIVVRYIECVNVFIASISLVMWRLPSLPGQNLCVRPMESKCFLGRGVYNAGAGIGFEGGFVAGEVVDQCVLEQDLVVALAEEYKALGEEPLPLAIAEFGFG